MSKTQERGYPVQKGYPVQQIPLQGLTVVQNQPYPAAYPQNYHQHYHPAQPGQIVISPTTQTTPLMVESKSGWIQNLTQQQRQTHQQQRRARGESSSFVKVCCECCCECCFGEDCCDDFKSLCTVLGCIIAVIAVVAAVIFFASLLG